PGALKLPDEARARGPAVGEISNCSARLPALLAALGVDDRVDFLLGSALEDLEKPDPVNFRRAPGRAGVAPPDAVHAGDDLEKDFLGARRAGLRAVLVDHADAHASLGHPRARDLAHLLELVRRLAS